MQTLNQDIKDRSFKSAYLLFGDEAFLKKSYKNRLKEAITGGDTMNYNYYEGKGINVPEILGMADTMPFFEMCIRDRSMPACKSALDAACGVERSTVVTAMARNGVEFGIKVSGLGKRCV